MPGLIPPQPQGNNSLNIEALYQQWAQSNPDMDAEQAFMAGADAILQAGGGTDDVAAGATSQVPDNTATDTTNGMLDTSKNWRNFKIDITDVKPGG